MAVYHADDCDYFPALTSWTGSEGMTRGRAATFATAGRRTRRRWRSRVYAFPWCLSSPYRSFICGVVLYTCLRWRIAWKIRPTHYRGGWAWRTHVVSGIFVLGTGLRCFHTYYRRINRAVLAPKWPGVKPLRTFWRAAGCIAISRTLKPSSTDIWYAHDMHNNQYLLTPYFQDYSNTISQ